ncbi:MAG TPA: zinc-binding dehydrogenase [Polyangiaceae bacterium]|nr:zinc-binding dehydrogenase [Polyangiaceae bacterium]
MADKMWALTYDRRRGPWSATRGLLPAEVARPRLDEAEDYRDRSRVLVKTRYAGFCGSDRGIWFRRAFGDMIEGSLDRDKTDVRVIGHELLGEVVAVGADGQRTYGLEVGDLVSTESHIVCGVCYQCRVGDSHVCADDKIIGISDDGVFAEYAKLPAKALWRTDVHKIRPEVAAIQEPFGNAVHACTKVNLRGKRVAIVGCGTIGLFAVAIARALGASLIVGVEPLANHAAMATTLGADVVLSPRNTAPGVFEHDRELTSRIRALTDGVGVDVALEMTGQNSSVNNAIACVRRGGDVILFGLKTGDAVIENFDRLIVDGISLHSVIGRRLFESWHITRQLLESRDPNLHDMVWDTILERGQGTIVPARSFSEKDFGERILAFPKVLLQF